MAEERNFCLQEFLDLPEAEEVCVCVGGFLFRGFYHTC